MPRIVTDQHPAEIDLLGFAAGRPGADPEVAEHTNRHLDRGCPLCERRLMGLTRLVRAVRDEAAFKKTFDTTQADSSAKNAGRTLAMVPRRQSLEELYNLSRTANEPAAAIVAAAKTSVEEAEKVIRSLDGDPRRAFALLYAAQKGIPVVPAEPVRMQELSELLFEESSSLLDAKQDARTPTSRELVQAECALLESYAHLQLGHNSEAREAAEKARSLFSEGGDVSLGRAFCDYYGGQAAFFERDFAVGERLLKKALRTFAEFGQEHLVAWAQIALGTLFGNRGNYDRALQYLDNAVEAIDAKREPGKLAAAHLNRGTALSRLERFDEARAAYARALSLARSQELRSILHIVRNGLADLDFRRGQYQRALNAFSVLANDALVAGYDVDVVFARLYIAECLGRLGFMDRMADEITSLRQDKKAHPFAASPAMEELFSCLDQGMVDADLVGHVRRYLEDAENGIQRPYQRLRLVG